MPKFTMGDDHQLDHTGAPKRWADERDYLNDVVVLEGALDKIAARDQERANLILIATEVADLKLDDLQPGVCPFPVCGRSDGQHAQACPLTLAQAYVVASLKEAHP